MAFRFTSECWKYPTENGAWYFVSLPRDVSEKISTSSPKKRGFGSVRVEVICGNSTWNTSIFPDSKSRTYILPIKASIRKAEGIDHGSEVSISVSLINR